MIIRESQFLFVILITIIITYVGFLYFNKCDLDCKINYNKHNNYHTIKEKEQPVQQVQQVQQKEQIKYIPTNNSGPNIGSRLSAHAGTINPKSLYNDNDNDNINRFLQFL